jgi:hypothetical protein
VLFFHDVMVDVSGFPEFRDGKRPPQQCQYAESLQSKAITHRNNQNKIAPEVTATLTD